LWSIIGNLIELFTVLLIAQFGDRIGRRPFLIVGAICAAVYFPILVNVMLLKNVFCFISHFTLAIMGLRW
jgi:hypothetical protein